MNNIVRVKAQSFLIVRSVAHRFSCTRKSTQHGWDYRPTSSTHLTRAVFPPLEGAQRPRSKSTSERVWSNGVPACTQSQPPCEPWVGHGVVDIVCLAFGSVCSGMQSSTYEVGPRSSYSYACSATAYRNVNVVCLASVHSGNVELHVRARSSYSCASTAYRASDRCSIA